MAKKRSKTVPVIITVLIILAIITVATSLYYTQKYKTPTCENTCEADFCQGFNYYSCEIQENGCKAPVDNGKIVGKCDVATLPTDCQDDEVFVNYDQGCNKVTKTALKQEKQEKPITTYADTCGNNVVEFGETCATCPTDVICPKRHSCMYAECKEYGLLPQGGSTYCGYPVGSLQVNEGFTLNYNIKGSSQSCVADYAPDHDASKLADKKIGMSDNMWECMNKQGLSYPQHASVELETEMLLNGVKVVQSGVGHDGYNVQKLSVYFSQDSTNGEDGHWVKMGETIMRNSYNDWENIFFPPTTATWVRVQVDQGFNQDKFAISELKIYEAPYVCDPDYDRFGDLY